MNNVTVGLALLAGSFFAVSCCNGTYAEQEQEYPAIIAGQSDVTIEDAFTAVIEGRQDVEIYPQLSGKISKVCIKEGQQIKQGQILPGSLANGYGECPCRRSRAENGTP